VSSPSAIDARNRRRSRRLKLRIPVLVRMQNSSKQSVSELTHTIIVNSHGALLLLANPVAVNQIIRVENSTTREELLCRVTSLGTNFMGKTQVGVEFICPAPEFWRDESKPGDTKKLEPKRR
jgi:hypothetical protein